jgi:hypothetical protein
MFRWLMILGLMMTLVLFWHFWMMASFIGLMVISTPILKSIRIKLHYVMLSVRTNLHFVILFVDNATSINPILTWLYVLAYLVCRSDGLNPCCNDLGSIY